MFRTVGEDVVQKQQATTYYLLLLGCGCQPFLLGKPALLPDKDDLFASVRTHGFNYHSLLSWFVVFFIVALQYVGPHTTPKLAATRKPRRTHCKLSFDLHGSIPEHRRIAVESWCGDTRRSGPLRIHPYVHLPTRSDHACKSSYIYRLRRHHLRNPLRSRSIYHLHNRLQPTQLRPSPPRSTMIIIANIDVNLF
jgi:hypothetical protein